MSSGHPNVTISNTIGSEAWKWLFHKKKWKKKIPRRPLKYFWSNYSWRTSNKQKTSVYMVELEMVVSSVQSLSREWFFVTWWTAAPQTSLSITNFQSLLKHTSIELVIPSNHLILCRPLLLSPSIFPSIRVFSNESVLHIRWPKYWSFSFSISPFNEYPGVISFRMDCLDLFAV